MAKNKTIEIEVPEDFVLESGIAIMWGYDLDADADANPYVVEYGIGERPPTPLMIGLLRTSAQQFEYDFVDTDGRPDLWSKEDGGQQ